MKRVALAAAVGLWAASASAHPPEECRTMLASFSQQADAFENSAKVTWPVFERLFAAWDEAVEAKTHAQRHAVIYRHFVSEFPVVRLLLTEQLEASSQAVYQARRTVSCLSRDR